MNSEKQLKSLVSIIIPVYNGENYLKEAIDSALAQTYEPVEILVVNDGSKDRTEEIAKSYGDKIRYFNKENGGVSSALNLGINNMRGEYFSWLSHDDLYMPEKIEREIAVILDVPEQIVYSDYSVIDKKGKIIARMDIAKKFPGDNITLGLFPILKQVLNGCTLLIHNSHFKRAGVFNENLRTTQDYDLWFKMLKNEKLVYINESLVMQREHGYQGTHNYQRNRIESDELWLYILQNITKEEACLLHNTEWEFWDKQVEILCFTHFKKALAYAKERLSGFGGNKTSISRLARIIIYSILSLIASLARLFHIQNIIRDSVIFRWGYKIWFKNKNMLV